MILDELFKNNQTGLEAEISAGIIERIARELPELNDHSPGSPHVVIAEGVAWGTSLLLYYLARQPELYENWILRYLYGATPLPPRQARAELVLSWSTPAGPGGRLVNAGTQFEGGGTTWTVLDTFVYPPDAMGNEVYSTDIGPQPLYRIPVVADAAGSRYNTAAGTITKVTEIMPGLISVSNPFPATGGEDEEPYEAMRARIFSKRLEEDLLVIPRDFEIAVAHYLGEMSRTMVIVPPPTPGYVHLSVLYPDGTPLVVNLGLEEELNRRSPMAPVRFVPPTVVDIPIVASLYFNPQSISPERLQALATQALATRLDPRFWGGWGSTPNVLYRSDIISLLQGLPGVVSVELAMPAQDVDLGSPNAVTRMATPVFTTVAVSMENLT